MVNKDDEVIFIYSEIQDLEEKNIAKNIGKTFSCGNVSTGSSVKKYSKIIKPSELNHMIGLYPDAKIIAQGKLSKMSYTETKIS